jgi:hypothetical protein
MHGSWNGSRRFSMSTRNAKQRDRYLPSLAKRGVRSSSRRERARDCLTRFPVACAKSLGSRQLLAQLRPREFSGTKTATDLSITGKPATNIAQCRLGHFSGPKTATGISITRKPVNDEPTNAETIPHQNCAAFETAGAGRAC